VALTPAARRTLQRRIAKARRRLARGIDLRTQSNGEVSEKQVMKRLEKVLERDR
jgi:hypothetical protein